MTEQSAGVVARASCKNCIRPIAYVVEVGWVHDEIPEYAAEPIGCSVAAPAELRCPECEAVSVRTNHGLVVRHLPPGSSPGDEWCSGSWAPGEPIVGAVSR